jgi:predicted glycosyltransferase involved in capsule biosynthesis
MAFWKNDLLIINGYNEEFESWGKEDNDLSIRLINAGKTLRLIKFNIIIYHLYHKEINRDKLSFNESIYFNSLNKKVKQIDKGINQYL